MFLLRHVTSLAAILVCSLLVSQAHSASDAALLKLLTGKQSHSQDTPLSPSSSSSSSSSSQSALSSYLNDYNSAFPSSLSAGDRLWLESAGSNPLLMRDEGAEAEEVDEAEAEAGKHGTMMSAVSKRFHPSAFFGSRGKRVLRGGEEGGVFGKRFYESAFVGHRGKRMRIGEEDEEDDEEEGLGKRMMGKRFNPMGFVGSRGKRYLPGLEALFLTQMYKKLDAEKWKRQSLLGFHAARG